MTVWKSIMIPNGAESAPQMFNDIVFKRAIHRSDRVVHSVVHHRYYTDV
jgi:hypothetical protein